MTTKEVGTVVKRKPPAAGRGRVKGALNKNTGAIKDMILAALSDAGGVEYLTRCANDPKTAAAFLGLIGKVMPTQIAGIDGAPIQTVTRIELVALK